MRRRHTAIITAGLLALALPTSAAHAAPPDAADRFQKVDGPTLVSSTFRPAIADQATKVQVIVQLSGDPVALADAKSGNKLSAAQKAAHRSKLKWAQDRIRSRITAAGGTVQSQMQSAYNGMRVSISRSQVAKLRALPGVVGVHLAPVRSIDNTVSVPYLGVPAVWQNTGKTGEGIKVAVIDTGIDYTHAGFQGPGTAAAWNTAHAGEAQPANSAWFGPSSPRIKGGWDFVGDAYNADNGDTPKPDANPIDCFGHGSHVAGTIGGNGVLANGTAYTGPYDSSTHSNSFKVGPGVAPEVDLYAYKVFGCEGTTNVTTEAIDRAVLEGMDVINMSLGSSFGRADDPDAVAASNAVADGVVVVASAGNSGPNPYLVGSPSTGRGVISVAANDATATFPAAKLTFNGTSMDAINANGFSPLPTDSFTIVNLTDDPATPANESLGCSTGDFARVGITTDAGAPKVVAVVKRGTCARVAKAIYGQQAGADAVIMVNTDNSYPPYEGPITSNPDTGDAFTVTIPFLGVRASDGAALLAADGTSLTMAAAELTNPNFTKAASFSSGGPRSGDSGARPTITAPGVSISSVGVGTGTGADINSGTSMAAPHVAGVAALAVQAHPTWTANQVSAALASTADPAKIGGYRQILTGGGLVDTAQSVATTVFAAGDPYSATSTNQFDYALNFGFAESNTTFSGTKTVTLTNTGASSVTFAVSVDKTSQSRPSTVTPGSSSVTVPAGGTATVDVSLSVPAATVGSVFASSGGQHKFYEVSGDVVFTADSGTLRVPYLLVPRATSKIQATGTIPAKGSASVTLTNPNGAMGSYADFYTLGLEDRKDLPTNEPNGGLDLRAVGVQSFSDPTSATNELLVFAVNAWTRYSNAAELEYDVAIDQNKDKKLDAVLFAADYGLVTTGTPDGRLGTFIWDRKSGITRSTGYLATAPTDGSTVLLPVETADLTKGSQSGPFRYTAATFGVFHDLTSDSISGWATYLPNSLAITTGQIAAVPVGGSVTVQVPVDSGQLKAQAPLGIMVVALDNAAGADEAILLRR